MPRPWSSRICSMFLHQQLLGQLDLREQARRDLAQAVQRIHVEELRLAPAVRLQVIGERAAAVADADDRGLADVVVVVRRVERRAGHDLKPHAVALLVKRARDAGRMTRRPRTNPRRSGSGQPCPPPVACVFSRSSVITSASSSVIGVVALVADDDALVKRRCRPAQPVPRRDGDRLGRDASRSISTAATPSSTRRAVTRRL